MLGLFERNGANDMAYALKALSVKNSTISRNIANVDTPDYKSTKLEFAEVMENYNLEKSKERVELSLTNSKHIQIKDLTLDAREHVRFQNNPSLRNDGNDVNIDYEMSQQADTSIRYTMYSDLVGKKLRGMVDLARTP